MDTLIVLTYLLTYRHVRKVVAKVIDAPVSDDGYFAAALGLIPFVH